MAWETQAEVIGGFADEAGLVAGLRAGRAEAYEALHAAYAAPIYNLALRIVEDPQEAEDVAQEVLLKVFRGLPGGETEVNLAAWLYRVTVNAAFDQLRARKRRPLTAVEDDGPEAADAVDGFERAELSRRVESTLRELPKRQQLALVLRDVHGLSVGETASVLGLTKGSADVLLSRARSGFRRIFLAGAGSISGRCDLADKALAAGVGRGEPMPASLLEHSRTCPDCRRTVELWGAAPVGIGLLVSQVALPAKLSLGATLAAAKTAGIVLPAGLGVGAAAGAASSAGVSAAGAGAAGGASAAATTASAAGTAAGGVLAALGSAAGVKVATIAAVATAAVGIAGVSAHETTRAGAEAPAAAASSVTAPAGYGAGAGGQGGHGTSSRERARLLAHAGAGGGAAGARAGVRSGDGRGDGQGQGDGRTRQPAGGGQGAGVKDGTGAGSKSSGSSGGQAGSGVQAGSGAGTQSAGSGQGGGSGQTAGTGQSGSGQGAADGGSTAPGGQTGGSGGPVSRE